MISLKKLSLSCLLGFAWITMPCSAFDNKAHSANAPKQNQEILNPLKIPPHLKAVGDSNIYYTDSSVMPPSTDKTYPYSTIGKLWFTKPDGSAGLCTGSVIRPGIVLTAGHCVHSGKNSEEGWFKNFRFAPGYRKGNAPFGIWDNWAYADAPSEWLSGGGSIPHPTDYALIVFNKNSNDQRIGDLTSWLGYWTYKMIGSHITVLGYATNLDIGRISHRVDSNVAKAANNTGVFGSNMAGGSDGSPVILNFGEPAVGDPNKWVDRDFVVSVVSYSGRTSLMRQGGSQLDERFITLMNKTCSLYSWAC